VAMLQFMSNKERVPDIMPRNSATVKLPDANKTILFLDFVRRLKLNITMFRKPAVLPSSGN
jgi:hypothetical protein